MANETYVTIIGRLTGDAELRYTPSGAGVANFTVASNARMFDKNSNEWKNKPTTFWRCAAWNQGEKQRLAENVCDALKKGDSVIVRGEIESREYTTKEGAKRTVMELRVETIGKDLRRHQPAANNVQGQNASQGGGWGGNPPAAQEDPWGAPATSNTGGGWGNGPGNEPPF
ncbi:single-stranded DNA-binding protein [Arthrobacter sp. ISL-69]|uniref:single-stranded DNA-binding protein n=1 Tax=Arthrobacter sp. ISL-69 TaxID=2819113 RepID=UPI001BE8C93A|nr:single-stranded DNA-binding protein [Arthrobacter sp. ISL-69]MBT2537248.1 single-stranded DNA-binding protein [Arthrobacter sp. ISL-69]